MSGIAEAIALALPSFTGQLLRPDDAAYDYCRRVHNGLIAKRPAAIASCHGVADIADAVGLARAAGLEVSVRGGGHNVAGRATIDQGLMIDLSPMKGIHVDVAARRVRAQGGVLWRELNRETQLHGLGSWWHEGQADEAECRVSRNVVVRGGAGAPGGARMLGG